MWKFYTICMAELDIERINWDQAAKIFAPEKENWEKKLKKRWKKYPLAKDLLMILAAGGVLTLGVMAPPLGTFVAKELIWRDKSKFNQRLARLKNRKLVTVSYKNGEPVVEITQDGFKKALDYKFNEMKIKTPAKWDNKWRVVIFDVSKKKGRQRDRLRGKLKELGFLILNESVLIYPYSCVDEIEFVRQVFSLNKEVTYLTADRFEGDDYYYSWFFEEE